MKLKRQRRKAFADFQKRAGNKKNIFNVVYFRLSLEGLVQEFLKPRGGRDEQVLQCRLNLGKVEEQEGELDRELGLLITDLFGSRFSELGIGAVHQVGS